jgi:PAS domain S-box-containing protein
MFAALYDFSCGPMVVVSSVVTLLLAAVFVTLRLRRAQAKILALNSSLAQRIEDLLQQRHAELRALADSSPGMMGTFHARADGSLCMPYVSPNIEKLFGLQPQDVVHDAAPLLARTHPDDAQRVAQTIAESARNMSTWHEEYRILHPVLGERWLESHTNPQPHPQGGVIWYGYVHDITERKHAETELELARRLLNSRNEQLLASTQTLEQRVAQRTAELEESRSQLRGLIGHREQVREVERRYIAREVHDELGQILTGLQMSISYLEHQLEQHSPQWSESLEETKALSKEAMAMVKNVASSLRPAVLDVGIVAALEWLAGRLDSNTHIHCNVQVPAYDISLDEAHSIALFRIAQEALTNVARHARADRIDISLDRDGDDYVLRVRDNGVGFDTSVLKRKSFGLVGIRERVLLLSGTLGIHSRPGAGTEIEVRIPVQERTAVAPMVAAAAIC